jgi:hypothetical protein
MFQEIGPNFSRVVINNSKHVTSTIQRDFLWEGPHRSACTYSNIPLVVWTEVLNLTLLFLPKMKCSKNSNLLMLQPTNNSLLINSTCHVHSYGQDVHAKD